MPVPLQSLFRRLCLGSSVSPVAFPLSRGTMAVFVLCFQALLPITSHGSGVLFGCIVNASRSPPALCFCIVLSKRVEPQGSKTEQQQNQKQPGQEKIAKSCHFLSLGLFFDRLGCILVNFWSRLRPSGCFMIKFWSPWGPFGITFGVGAVPLANQGPGYSREISGKRFFRDF